MSRNFLLAFLFVFSMLCIKCSSAAVLDIRVLMMNSSLASGNAILMNQGILLWRDRLNNLEDTTNAALYGLPAGSGIRAPNGNNYRFVWTDIVAGSNAAARQAAARDIQNGVYGQQDIIISPYTSTGTENVMPILNSTDYVVLAPGAGVDSLFICTPDLRAKPGNRTLPSDCIANGLTAGQRRFSNLFSLQPANGRSFNQFVFLLNLKSVTSAAIVYENDIYGFICDSGMRLAAKQNGGKIQFATYYTGDYPPLSATAYPPGPGTNTLQNYPAIVNTICSSLKEKNFPVVFVPIFDGPPCVSIIQACEGMGYKPTWILGNCFGSSQVQAQISDKRFLSFDTYVHRDIPDTEDYVDSYFYPPSGGRTSQQLWFQDFNRSFPAVVPDRLQSLGSNTINVMLLAVKNYRDPIMTASGLNNAIQRLFTSSWFGKIQFDAFGRLNEQLDLGVQVDQFSNIKVVGPLQVSQIDFIYPRPVTPDNLLVAGQTISWSTTPSTSVLSFVFAVLGSWTCLILVEQVIYERKSSSGFLVLLGSVSLAAATFAFCAVWSSAYILSYGISLKDYVSQDPLSLKVTPISLEIKYYSASALASWIPIFLCAIVTFFIMLLNIPVSAQAAQQRKMLSKMGKVSGSNDANNSKTAAGGSTTGANTGGGSKTGDSLEGSTAAGAGPADGTEKKQGSKQVSVFQDFLQVFTSISMWTVIGSLLLCVTVLICQVLLVYSMIIDGAKVSVDSGRAVGAAIYMFIVGGFSLQLYYHLHFFTFIPPFIMAISIFGVELIVTDALSFTYNPTEISSISSSQQFTGVVLTLIAAIMGAIICFVLLGLQFSRMKLSRNQLDLIVRKIQGRLKLSEQNVVKLTGQVEVSKSQLAHILNCMELISYIRPIMLTSAAANILCNSTLTTPTIVKPITTGEGIAEEDDGEEERKDGKGKGDDDDNQPEHSVSKYEDEDEEKIEKDLEAVMSSNAEGITAILAQIANMNNTERFHYFAALKKYLENRNSIANLQAISLTDVLAHPVCLELFKDCVAIERSSENLSFILVYKQFQKSRNKNIRRVLADSIIKDFILPSAKYSINISSRVRTAILELKQSSGSNVSATIFDSAYTEIYTLMNRDSWSRFSDSPQFILASLLINSAKQNNVNFAGILDGKQPIASVLGAKTLSKNSKESKVRSSKLSKMKVVRTNEPEATTAAVNIEIPSVATTSTTQVADSSNVSATAAVPEEPATTNDA